MSNSSTGNHSDHLYFLEEWNQRVKALALNNEPKRRYSTRKLKRYEPYTAKLKKVSNRPLKRYEYAPEPPHPPVPGTPLEKLQAPYNTPEFWADAVDEYTADLPALNNGKGAPPSFDYVLNYVPDIDKYMTAVYQIQEIWERGMEGGGDFGGKSTPDYSWRGMGTRFTNVGLIWETLHDVIGANDNGRDTSVSVLVNQYFMNLASIINEHFDEYAAEGLD